MGKGYRTRNNKRNKGFAMAFLSLMLVYLVFHLFVSERSIPNLIKLSQQEIELQSRLAQLTSEKNDLQDTVTRLHPDTLDIDLVEEYTIQMLGHNTGHSIIIVADTQL